MPFYNGFLTDSLLLTDEGRTDKVTTCVSLFRLPTQNLLWLSDVQVDTDLTLVASNQALR